MKFSIKFSASRNYAIDIPAFKIGTEKIDFIRKELGLLIPSELIKEDVSGRSIDPCFNISEKKARNSGKFKNTNNFVVNCEDKQLNKFCFEHVKTCIDKSTGEILKVWIIIKYDKDKIMEWWASENYFERYNIM